MATTKYVNRKTLASPEHKMIYNLVFEETENTTGEQAVHLAELADALAYVAEGNGLTINDIVHLLPLVLRMLKVKHQWSGL